MPKLSIIIVNYNVKYFLEQALLSIYKAARAIETEIFVVDNRSTDGSVEMIREKFPDVLLIANKDNKGFACANNQAIQRAKGEYILLINPDTLVQEDTFKSTMSFMDKHPDAGALGVKMLDGKGIFLPESRRSLPTPAVAFYKIFGLSKLFPRSKTFGKYHLSYLDEDQIHEVEVLAGAFMLIRKKVLDEIGLLDEHFFMYGEDIDLSYRIIQAGYKNYYFPRTRIIHYKGESTKKEDLNYVRLFYHAMIIFAKKHFSQGKAQLFTMLIHLGIYLKAATAVLARVVNKIYLPLLDAAALYAGMYFIKDFWEKNVKVHEGVVYPPEYMLIIVPVYILIWLTAVFFSGGYDIPTKIMRVLRGLFIGTVLIAAGYGFLEESYRFSRGMIVLGAGWAVFAMISLRTLIHFLRFRTLRIEESEEKKIIIVGDFQESQRVFSLLQQQPAAKFNFIGFVSSTCPDPSVGERADEKNKNYLGDTSGLKELAELYQPNEVIFCSKDASNQQIIQWMSELDSAIGFKTVAEGGGSIIGSSSKDTQGDLYALDKNYSIMRPLSKRHKRILDILICGGLLISSPIVIFRVTRSFGFMKNWLLVLIGKKSWVGYHLNETNTERLPSIKPGVLTPTDIAHANHPRGKHRDRPDQQTINRLNRLYARDYTTDNDFHIIRKGFKQLGRK